MTDLLGRAIGWRAGAGVAAAEVGQVPGDPAISQWSATSEPVAATPSGGAGWDATSARAAAIGELLERTGWGVAIQTAVPRTELPADETCWPFAEFHLHTTEQRRSAGFPLAVAYATDSYVRYWDLLTNEPVHVPEALVAGGHTSLATSSGLAAGPTRGHALLRAVQELVERDALMTTWLYGVAARRIPTPEVVRRVTDPLHADVTVLDITPAYSPHPVIVVAGSSLADGMLRCGVGLSCRASAEEAAAKATLEWAQAITFTGWTARSVSGPVNPATVRSFDDHARYYTLRPDHWAELPWFTGPDAAPPPGAPDGTPIEQLRHLVGALTTAGVRLAYRDLTTVDTAGCGVKVVRVVSPDVANIHSDHLWPFLDLEADRADRLYPGLPRRTPFPSPYPHPLG